MRLLYGKCADLHVIDNLRYTGGDVPEVDLVESGDSYTPSRSSAALSSSSVIDVVHMSEDDLPVCSVEETMLRLCTGGTWSPSSSNDAESDVSSMIDIENNHSNSSSEVICQVREEPNVESMDDISIDSTSNTVAREHLELLAMEKEYGICASMSSDDSVSGGYSSGENSDSVSDFKGFDSSEVIVCVGGCTRKTLNKLLPRLARGQNCAHCERKFYLQGRKQESKWIFCFGCQTWVCPTCRASEWPCVCPPASNYNK